MAQKSGDGLSWWRNALVGIGLKAASYGAGQSLTLKDAALGRFFGMPSATGKTVTDEAAIGISTVWACVRLLAETVGAMPLAVFERQKDGNSKKIDHPLSDVLIGSPNSDMTSQEFREAKTANLAMRGNAYSLKEVAGNGDVSSLYPIPAADVEPKRERDGSIVFRVNDRGRWETLPQEKIWHWKGFGFNGVTGLSPLAYARESMGLALASEEFGARLFANGASVSAILSIPGWLKPDQREIAKKNLDELASGMRTHKPTLLEGGMELKGGIFPPEDLQFLQLRQFSVRDLCRFYRIDPHMVGDLERATHNNIEQLSLEFVMYTIMPYLTRVEASAAKWLLKPGDRSRFFLRFNFEGLLRADSVARAQLYSILLQNGVFNRNDVRALENRNRSDAAGMDDYTVQSNMALIQMLEALVASKNTGAKGDQPTNISVNPMLGVTLPDSMRHNVKHDVEISGLKDLAGQVAASVRQAERLFQSLVSAQERFDLGFTDLAKRADRPRRAVFDRDGNPIGTEPVESLH